MGIPVSPRRVRGNTLIGLLFAISVMGVLFTMWARQIGRQHEDSMARVEGNAAGQFAVGLRGFMAAAQANPALIPAGVRTGVDWLKAPACGGLATNPPEGYVPCDFTGGTLGPQYQTRFTYNAATGYLEARTDFIAPVLGDRPTNRILMADKIALAANSTAAVPGNGMFFRALSNVPVTATAPLPASTPPGADAGRVLLIASNAPSNDIFLRTDGTNQMLASLNMGGFSIGNALDGRFAGDVRVEQRLQVDQGMTVQGVADLRGGAVTSDIALTSIGRYASEGIYNAQVYTGATEYLVAKPNCAQAGNNPGIYVAIQSTGTAPNSDALWEARADVYDQGAQWRIVPVVRATRLTLSSSDGNLIFDKQGVDANPTDMRLLVMTRCR